MALDMKAIKNGSSVKIKLSKEEYEHLTSGLSEKEIKERYGKVSDNDDYIYQEYYSKSTPEMNEIMIALSFNTYQELVKNNELLNKILSVLNFFKGLIILSVCSGIITVLWLIIKGLS